MKMVMPRLTSLLAAGAWASISLGASAATPARTFNTSFDCATAREPVEKLICRDARLAQMDIELTRLYRLALTDEHSVPRPDKVEIDQRFWLLARDQCASDADPKVCTVRRYAERAHQLRQGSAIARTKDPSRRTEGPQAFRCAGLGALVAATYFTVEPAVVYLKWANTSTTLEQVSSPSGTLYKGNDYRGSQSFWQEGNDALLQMPGAGPMRCTVEPVS
ncbi:hypothetical protein PMI35_05268 [Pseudomonas sp. GM78]|uniref:MliC family protein n=1 Tax=Pseudomonas sp. GM78 TaxID=1144337 RepID=UPI0002708ACC|nr:MliC family protein [Pseudomonas sp. GM78]EJN21331.1 hypothetical protein PMI35_05268 [Pseudomonas sp. GM78]